MRRFIVLVGLGLVGPGCNGASVREPDEPNEPVAVYEAVLRQELKGANNGAGCYLFIDGKDPAPELLDRLLKQWPELQAGSKQPKGKATSVSLEELKWIDHNTAEVRGGFSNGIDGHHKRYRVIRKNGEWLVDGAQTEAISYGPRSPTSKATGKFANTSTKGRTV